MPFALQNRALFDGEKKGCKGAQKKGGRGVASKGGKKEKRTCENRSVSCWVNLELKIETSDGKNLVKFGGRTLLPAKTVLDISGQISEKSSEASLGDAPEQFKSRYV